MFCLGLFNYICPFYLDRLQYNLKIRGRFLVMISLYSVYTYVKTLIIILSIGIPIMYLYVCIYIYFCKVMNKSYLNKF